MARQPNVVVFLTDQQRWDCSALHGNPLDLMPNFDRLAAGGTHVANSFSCQPVCAPVRSSLQLGRYATHTGVWKNGLNPDRTLPSLAGQFNDAGYATSYIGKWHLYDSGEGPPGPVPQEYRLGYQRWLASNLLEFTSDAYQTTLYNNDDEPVELYGYRVDACVDAAIQNVVELSKSEQPFFLFLSLIEPHQQNSRDDYPAPEGFRSRYEGRWMPPDLQHYRGNAHQHIAGYYGMVKRIDDALGRLHDTLISLDILDDTVLLFTSDHGCHFKTRNSEYKRSLHDASIRVPTMLTGGPFTGGGTVQNLVSHVDLPATLLDACGIPVPESFQGRSLLAADATWPDEVFVQISESETGRAIRTKRWKYGVRAPGTAGNGDVEPWAPEMQETFLYDLYSDPYEIQNLVQLQSHRALCDRLRERLLKRMVEAGEQAPVILPPDEIAQGGQRIIPER
ncbi:MAG: arylsulfatase, partial [Spirochaetaceae bacterium]